MMTWDDLEAAAYSYRMGIVCIRKRYARNVKVVQLRLELEI